MKRYPNAEAYIHKKTGGQPFELLMDGMPEGKGTVASRFATHPDEPSVFYAANNHGLFRSADAGQSWKALEISWPTGSFATGVQALVLFAD